MHDARSATCASRKVRGKVPYCNACGNTSIVTREAAEALVARAHGRASKEGVMAHANLLDLEPLLDRPEAEALLQKTRDLYKETDDPNIHAILALLYRTLRTVIEQDAHCGYGL